MDQNFLDPLQSKKNGRPYAETRYEEIVKECWYISNRLNTSYTDILDISYTERVLLIGFINEQDEATRKHIEEQQSELERSLQKKS